MTEKAKTRALATYDKQASCKALSAMYKNVTMAKHSIKILNEYVKQPEIKRCLDSQIEKYNEYINEIEDLGEQLGHTVRRERKAYLVMAKMGIKMQMLMDNSTSHASKIMLKGTLMGIIDINEMLNQTSHLEPETLQLAKRLAKYEEMRMDELKKYL